jgi:hypothetical protein
VHEPIVMPFLDDYQLHRPAFAAGQGELMLSSRTAES